MEHSLLEQRIDFGLIRYASCWEDAAILTTALNAGPNKRILSIASGGDNAFLLASTGAEVVAADLSFPQLACMELKALAIRRLDYEDLLCFLGIHPSRDRRNIYAVLCKQLTPSCRKYWDACPDTIHQGIVHAGKFEHYFQMFRHRIMPLIHSRSTITELLRDKNRQARDSFYDKQWNTWRWRMLFRVFFSRFLMGHLGRDPEFFRYVEGSVANRIMQRARYALTALPTHTNPYLGYILTGNFDPALPPYLEPSQFKSLRNGLDRIIWHQGAIEEVGLLEKRGGFDGFNLSDICEYLDSISWERVYRSLLDCAKPGARLAYWNMLVPRVCPSALQKKVVPLSELARQLFDRDRAFFYSAFNVEEVL